MEIVDLSHGLQNGISVYPGTTAPAFTTQFTVETHGYKETQLDMLSHVGTHVDCPAHIFEDGETTDIIDLQCFCGKAVVIDCSHLAQGETLELHELLKYKDQIKEPEFVLFYTGWSKFWNTDDYFTPFPVISEDILRFLIKLKIKGIGIDAISIDPMNSTNLPRHKLLLSSKLIIIENLNNLDLLINRKFSFYCFPLKIVNGDGSPVRAVAIIEN